MSSTTAQGVLPDSQQPNGFLGKPPGGHISSSRDDHMTNSSGGVEDGLLLEDPFYNFSEMDQDSMAVLDPSDPNSIPFLDDSFMDIPAKDVGSEFNVGSEFGTGLEVNPEASAFNPDLFNSILSTGDEILARLESTSSVASGSATSSSDHTSRGGVSVGGASRGSEGEAGEHERIGSWDEGVTDSVFTPVVEATGTEEEDPFDDFVRNRALSTINEDQGEGNHSASSEDSESEYIHLDNIQTSLVGLPRPQDAGVSRPQEGSSPLVGSGLDGSSMPRPLDGSSSLDDGSEPRPLDGSSEPRLTDVSVEGGGEGVMDVEEMPPAPPRSSSLKDSPALTPTPISPGPAHSSPTPTSDSAPTPTSDSAPTPTSPTPVPPAATPTSPISPAPESSDLASSPTPKSPDLISSPTPKSPSSPSPESLGPSPTPSDHTLSSASRLVGTTIIQDPVPAPRHAPIPAPRLITSSSPRGLPPVPGGETGHAPIPAPRLISTGLPPVPGYAPVPTPRLINSPGGVALDTCGIPDMKLYTPTSRLYYAVNFLSADDPRRNLADLYEEGVGLEPVEEERDDHTPTRLDEGNTESMTTGTAPEEGEGANASTQEQNQQNAAASASSGFTVGTPTDRSAGATPTTTPDHTPSSSSSTPNSCPMETDLDKSVRTPGSSPRLRRTSSINHSPVLRAKTPTPPSRRRPSSEMVVLQPLSPEHGGSGFNEQYEFLRRTLSHSQRRYSQRGRPPKKQRQTAESATSGEAVGNGDVVRNGDVPNRVSVANNSADVANNSGDVANNSSDVTNNRARVANGRRGLERAASARDYRQKKTIGHLRDIVRGGETSSQSGQNPDMEAHVDQHGRTYYMDHRNRTIAFDRAVTPGSAPQQQEIQTRREMLDRRYQSLQRSFRRSQRPTVNVRNQQRSPLTSSTRAAATSNLRTENNSLSLTIAEAEEMARGISSSSKKRSGSTFSGRWFFSKKGKSGGSGRRRSSNTPPSSTETSPQPESMSDLSLSRSSESSESGSRQRTSESESSSRRRVSGSNSRRRVSEPSSRHRVSEPESASRRRVSESESRQSVSDSESSSRRRVSEPESSSRQRVSESSSSSDVIVSVIEVASSAAEDTSRGANGREMTPGSIQSAEFESGTEDETFQRANITPSVQDTPIHVRPSERVVSPVNAEQDDESTHNLRGRQSTIVHASNLSQADQRAAARARVSAKNRKKNRQRLDTDELTNAIPASNQVPSVQSPAQTVAPTTEPSETTPKTTPTTEKPVERSAISRGSQRKSKRTAKNLGSSPALRFITRKDLYSFLSSAGTSGEEFFANRALMELVQRIRSNNTLFEKYEHSHHLVGALNKFADIYADLPKGWEKKLNKHGKVFFIDHENELTTFIDPRLPLPDTPYSYNPNTERAPPRQLSEPHIRPHHTVVSHSQSLDIDVTPAPRIVEPEPTSPLTPTVTTPTTSAAASSGAGLTVPSGDGSNRLSVASSTSVEVTPISYEDQVVAFFRQPDVAEQISQRYSRGVRPQFQAVIDAIKASGTPALERIQMSGSIATYELALVLSLFEEEISRMRPTPEGADTTVPEQPTPVPDPPIETSSAVPRASDSMKGKSTLQRRKEAFPTKLQNFKMQMARLGFVQGSRIKYNIRRDHLLEDAYEHIMRSEIKLLQMKRLNVTFKGEEGLDYGGPSREFFFLLSREIFNPYYGLFEYSANDTYTVQISSTAAFIHNNLEWFRFAGRVVGLVIVQGFLLDVFFTRTVYKSILGRHHSLKDMEALEPDFYNSLLWIRDNDPEPLDLTFTVEEEAFGQLNAHELKPGGNDIPVTEDNKDEYIDRMVKWRLDRGVAEQMAAFKKGFSEIMPIHLLSSFDAQELEFLTAGTLEIDVEDWKANTEYRNGYHAAHQVVMWFWQAVESFDNEERLRLLQFVTGTSSVPIAGFKALRGSNGPKKFTIDYFNDVQAFPRSHTCFNRVDLPPYPSYEVLYNKLRFAVTEGGGFGIE